MKKIKTQIKLSQEFNEQAPILKEIRQSDCMSQILFNLIFDRLINSVKKSLVGTEWNINKNIMLCKSLNID